MCNFRWPASAPRYFPTVKRRTLLQSTLGRSEENVSVCYLQVEQLGVENKILPFGKGFDILLEYFKMFWSV